MDDTSIIDDTFQEILQDFLIESFTLVEKLDEKIAALEKTPEDLELLNEIFHVIRTLKAASSFLNFDGLTHLAQHIEDVIHQAKDGDLIIAQDNIHPLVESIKLIKALLNTIRDTSNDAGIDTSTCVARLNKISAKSGIWSRILKRIKQIIKRDF